MIKIDKMSKYDIIWNQTKGDVYEEKKNRILQYSRVTKYIKRNQFLECFMEYDKQIVIKETKLEEYIKQSDIVIVGEGKLDAQSTMGKIPVTIAKLAKKYEKKVFAFAGIIEDKQLVNESSIFDRAFEIDRGDMPLDVAMIKANSISNLSKTVTNVFLHKL